MLRRWIRRLLTVEGLNSLAGYLGAGNLLGYLVSLIVLAFGAAVALIGRIEGTLTPYGTLGIIVTALVAALLLVAILLGAAWAADKWRHVWASRSKGYNQAAPPSSDRTAVPSSPRELRLPTAAELLHEQELRNVLRSVQDFIEEIGNRARKDLEGMIWRVAEVAAYNGTEETLALKFFVGEAMLVGHRGRMKTIIRDAKQAISERSIDHAQRCIIAFMNEYSHGERCLGILITATSINPSAPRTIEAYQRWLQSDERCVTRCHELMSCPLLKELKTLDNVVRPASEQVLGRPIPSGSDWT